ncbi:MAG TPA: DUF424 family protein [Candidatus Saccharimonadales bacterium]|nr:DUF424 family protein [Candidatus Saccharimonadales bacterium]
MIYIKVHTTPEGEIIAMCDSELLGKVYKEARLELDLLQYASFYKGDLIEEKAAESTPAINDFYTANIVGKRSVGIFVKKGIASESEIKTIKGVPYIHLYKLV